MTPDFLEASIAAAVAQEHWRLRDCEEGGTILNPRAFEKGRVVHVPPEDWTSGFHPGSLWLLLELSGDEAWRPIAKRHSAAIEEAKRVTWHHDTGFMVQCGFGNGHRMGETTYADIMVEAARSLAMRFRPAAGVIQSWDTGSGWMATRGWECPVIIDNMMNLELLMNATIISGDPVFAKIARSHADTTLERHYRSDGSCFHVVDFRLADGAVRSRETAQGASDASAWDRGQAWGVYGFAVMHRFTGEGRYLERSLASLDFIERHPRYPADGVPFWDFDAPGLDKNGLAGMGGKGGEPRDASAAAILASALYELSDQTGSHCRDWADRILCSLGSPGYRAATGTNGGFFLLHSTGSLPHGREIDVPLNYADYYYLEALCRRKRLYEGRPAVDRPSSDPRENAKCQ